MKKEDKNSKSTLERKLEALQELYDGFQEQPRPETENILETEVIDRGYKVTIGNISGEFRHYKKEISKLNILIQNEPRNKS
jgi:hypothetical protein